MDETYDPAIGQRRNTETGQFAGKDVPDAAGGLGELRPVGQRVPALNPDLRMTTSLAARQRSLIE